MINVTGDFVGSVAMEENAECEKERTTERETEGERGGGEREVRGQLVFCTLQIKVTSGPLPPMFH